MDIETIRQLESDLQYQEDNLEGLKKEYLVTQMEDVMYGTDVADRLYKPAISQVELNIKRIKSRLHQLKPHNVIKDKYGDKYGIEFDGHLKDFYPGFGYYSKIEYIVTDLDVYYIQTLPQRSPAVSEPIDPYAAMPPRVKVRFQAFANTSGDCIYAAYLADKDILYIRE